MRRSNFFLAALVVASLLASSSCFAQVPVAPAYNAKIPRESAPVAVGYLNASGAFIPITLTTPMPTIPMGTTTVTLPDPINAQISNPGSITATVALPVASAAVAAPTDALPMMLYGNDNSSLQRLFTAIVMGDGVNGNNMLPFANYLWNGASYDRETPKYDRVMSGVDYTINLATDTITDLSSVCSYTVPCTLLFSHRGTQWITFNAGDSAAQAQTRRRVKEDTEWSMNVGTSTVVPRFIADPTATSSMGVSVLSTAQ